MRLMRSASMVRFLRFFYTVSLAFSHGWRTVLWG
jgi:hypothetical protein